MIFEIKKFLSPTGDEMKKIHRKISELLNKEYEIARTTYYVESRELTMKFIEYYKPEECIEEIDIGIRIEHVRQHLRRLCIMCMNREKDQQLMEKVENIKKNIINRLENRFLWEKNN